MLPFTIPPFRALTLLEHLAELAVTSDYAAVPFLVEQSAGCFGHLFRRGTHGLFQVLGVRVGAVPAR